ncbi:helix-turn-helix domain-containing protein [Chryseobacterium sp. OSA05B]|uniref:helix-turn-helix domain-containing protein n=1 Tax=Chryseobacterium sp. OSA05B TaxID=2862650 RepID=UPI001CBFFA1F|nr:helix-turn-helix domain-containing protein [Chryseobacterium sp. OSA05B]
METTRPNYRKIYEDILRFKYPEKIEDCQSILSKPRITAKDIITINNIIFPESDRKTVSLNHKHRSYTTSDILEILNFQKKNKLSNTQVANHFRLSRNSIAKWKKLFL